MRKPVNPCRIHDRFGRFGTSPASASLPLLRNWIGNTFRPRSFSRCRGSGPTLADEADGWTGSRLSNRKGLPAAGLPAAGHRRRMDRDMGTNAVRFAVVLGTNEVASAIGVHLHREGFCVVLSHDPNPPVMRRKMAFHDALFGDTARVENVIGERIESTMDVFKALGGPQHVLVTWLGLSDLLPVRS